MSEFLRKMLVLDLNKDTFTYLGKNKSDYIILDATSCRHTLLKFQNTQAKNIIYITNTDKNKIKQLLAANGISISKADIVTFTSIPDKIFNEYMELFAQNLLQLCDEKHLILNETYPVPFNINNGSIEAFDYDAVSAERKAIERGYIFFRERFPEAHVIEFPEYAIGDANHKWGTYYFHYVHEYYDYGLKAIDIITQGNEDYETKKRKLNNLKKGCASMLREKYTPAFSYSLAVQSSAFEYKPQKSELYRHPYLSNYVTARIDIKNCGTDANDLDFFEISDTNATLQKPLWFKDNGAGYIVQSDCGNLRIRFRCKGSGIMKITLRGLDIRDADGKRIPFFIDYTHMCVNEKTIFSEYQNVCHDMPYNYQCNVQSNEAFTLNISWTLHDERKYHH